MDIMNHPMTFEDRAKATALQAPYPFPNLEEQEILEVLESLKEPYKNINRAVSKEQMRKICSKVAMENEALRKYAQRLEKELMLLSQYIKSKQLEQKEKDSMAQTMVADSHGEIEG